MASAITSGPMPSPGRIRMLKGLGMVVVLCVDGVDGGVVMVIWAGIYIYIYVCVCV